MNKKIQTELLNIVKKNYEEISEHYAETRKKALWPELVALLDTVPDNASILDVGCGSGKLLKALTLKNSRYLGIDPSAPLLEKARSDFPQAEFRDGDVLNLGEIKELDFDFVFCIAVLQHIPGAELRIKALKQLKNKISPSGRIVISVWDMWQSEKCRPLIWRFWLLKLIRKNQMDIGDILFDWKAPDGHAVSKRYYHAFSVWELKKLIKKAGLKIEKIYKSGNNIYGIIKR